MLNAVCRFQSENILIHLMRKICLIKVIMVPNVTLVLILVFKRLTVLPFKNGQLVRNSDQTQILNYFLQFEYRTSLMLGSSLYLEKC